MLNILTGFYLLLMAAAGWRLFTMAWTRGAKVCAAVILVIPLPMLFLAPALVQPARPFADLLRGIGIALMLSGAVSLLAGMMGAWLKARRA